MVIEINNVKYKPIFSKTLETKKPADINPKEKEAAIHISNLSLIDGNGKTTRVGYRMEDGKKVRFAKTTNDTI